MYCIVLYLSISITLLSAWAIQKLYRLQHLYRLGVNTSKRYRQLRVKDLPILYRISALVWRSVTGCAPSYLTDLCRLVSDLASRRALRSSARGELLVPRARSALKQRRAFSVIGPYTWNKVPLTIRLLPQNNMSSFCNLFKTVLFDRSWTESASQ